MQIKSKALTLIGFSSCGKTTLGQQLAKELKYTFIDTDRLIEKFHPSLSCRDIFSNFGEYYFRELESQVIQSLDLQSSTLLAIGGGTLLNPKNGEKLKNQSLLIYLKISAEALKKRIWQQKTLPSYLNADHPQQSFSHLYIERSQIYEKWADKILEMENLNIETALERIKILIQS